MSGNKAVKNGLAFESHIYYLLNSIPGVSIIKNIPYPSIYSAFSKKHKTRMEFRAENIKLTYDTLDPFGKRIRKTKVFDNLNIECKYQEKSGSIDEKYPLVYQNSLISDADATLFVYANPSSAIKSGAIEYIKHSALHSGERLIVLDINEFIDVIKLNYADPALRDINLEALTTIDDAVVQYKRFEKKHFNIFKKCISINKTEMKYVFNEYMTEQIEFYLFVSSYGVKNKECRRYIDNLQRLRTKISNIEAIYSDFNRL